MKDLAGALAVAVVVAAVSTKTAQAVNGSDLPGLIKGVLGQKYLLITTLTVAAASIFPRFMGSLNGGKELGTLAMYVFFVVIGLSASIATVLRQSPLLLLYAAIILAVNLVVTLVVGRLTGHPLEVLLVAANANTGGPTTAAAMAVGKGWSTLVLPAVLVGVWGYVIASYIGLWMGNTVRGLLER